VPPRSRQNLAKDTYNRSIVAVKIRLKRIGKTRTPHYRIVVADSRTHRDGRVIEEIGRYVPTNDPSIIEVNSERAQYWLSVGAQPTEQAAVLLKLTGDLANAKGEKKNTVKPQKGKEAFVVDSAKKSVVLPKVEKKAPVAEEAPAAEAAVEAPASDEVAAEAVAEVETAEVATEAVAEEVVAEAPAEEVVAEEAPAAEAEEPKAE
jgi:small subunit ribosomal protein S16